MVLVSFKKQFIYTKTNKTAGTSVEVFFEPECLPPEGYEQAHFRDETITDYGIVGFRGFNRPADTLWYNHMPAIEVREYLGSDVWDEYFKFCVIRNPFDKLTSMYFHNMNQKKKEYFKNRSFSELRRDFLDWIKNRPLGGDQDRYVINGSVCVDYFIRFEKLPDDLFEVCRKLQIERDVSDLNRFKSQSRFIDKHFSEFYDDEARKIVAESFSFELDRFGYKLLE